MRVTNPSSTDTVVVHDSLQDGRAYQFQPGIRDVVVGPLQSVTISNADAAQSRSLQEHIAAARLTVISHVEPFDATSGNSAMPGLAAGIQVVMRLVGQAAGVIALPASTGINAAADYMVLVTGADVAHDGSVVKGVADFTLTGTGLFDVLVLKIV